MAKLREPETNQGIQGEFNVATYDLMMRRLRDRGWMETRQIIQSGIDHGLVLEVGPGPGYLGLEWLKQTEATQLKGLDISPDMIQMAEKNARNYGFYNGRVEYILGNAGTMPFADEYFEAVFSNGSLHEWEAPLRIFAEIFRVLKSDGRFYVSDLRRDMSLPVKWLMKWSTRPKEILPGLESSIKAAYTVAEIRSMMRRTRFKAYQVSKSPMGLEITGKKK